MFCPLCKAEYREGFTECSTCGAALVADEAPESERSPALLKWVTHEQRIADRVVGELRGAGIPCYEKAATDFLSMAIARGRTKIILYILESTAVAAREASGVQFEPPLSQPLIPEGVALQDCPFCNARFAAGESRCPACGGDLLAWTPRGVSVLDVSSKEPPSEEVASQEGSEEPEPERVWRGGDPVTFSRALEVLRENDIPSHTRSTSEHLAFEFAMPRPKLVISVSGGDAARARELLQEFQDPFPLVPQEPFSLDADERMTPTETTEAVSLVEHGGVTKEDADEYLLRKSALRWGFWLVLFSCFLMGWVALPGAPFRHNIEPIRVAALVVLLGGAVVSGMAAIWHFYRAWSWQSDKIGLLSLFFALQGVVWLCLFATMLFG